MAAQNPKKRKIETLQDSEPNKKFKGDFASFSVDEVFAWVSQQGVPPTYANFISQHFTAKELLSLARQQLEPFIPQKISTKSTELLLKVIKEIPTPTFTQSNVQSNSPVKDNANTPNFPENLASPTPKMKREKMNAVIRSLKTEQDVVAWLNSVVDKPPPQISAEQLIGSVGAGFPYCASNETKQQSYRAALDCATAENFNKENIQIPFINGAPGVGKTRMLIESLNILQGCASESKKAEEEILTTKLNESSVLLYATFGNGNAISSKDSEFFINFNHTGTLAFRILWRYYLRSTFNELTQMQVTTELAKYLTLPTLIECMQNVGVGYIVLAIDEMNMLYDASKEHFRLTIQSISAMLLNKHKEVFVLFAGVIHSPLRQVITVSLGVPISISPATFSLSDIAKILTELENTFPYLKGWQRAGAFRRCVADLSNPPRLFDYLMEAMSANTKTNPTKNIFTLDYASIMASAIAKADAKSGRALSLGVKDAKRLMELCMLKQHAELNYELPSGETIEGRQLQGYIFWSKATGPSRQIAIPFYYLHTFLQLSNDPNYQPFESVRNLFKFSWQDEHALSPDAWENFNVKFTSFKLTLLHGTAPQSYSLAEFHSGALLGSDLKNIKVVPRATHPCKYLDQFPKDFIDRDIQKTNGLVSSMIDESAEVCLWTAVCKNGKNTTGIDAFFWLSDKVIEFQQHKANEDHSKNPTQVTQELLDEEYAKAEKLFKAYLEPEGYSFVFGLISNRVCSDELILKPNMYVVHKSNMEEYYGPSFASLAQIKSFTSVNVNTANVPQLMRIKGVTKLKAQEIMKLRVAKTFNDFNDLRSRVTHIQKEESQDVLIEF